MMDLPQSAKIFIFISCNKTRNKQNVQHNIF